MSSRRRLPYYLIRGHEVWIDHDVADLLHIETRHLNQLVKRHPTRFPEPLSFTMTPRETRWLREHSDLANIHFRGRTSLPRAFSYHGILMAASLLRTPRSLAVTLRLFHARPTTRQ